MISITPRRVAPGPLPLFDILHLLRSCSTTVFMSSPMRSSRVAGFRTKRVGFAPQLLTQEVHRRPTAPPRKEAGPPVRERGEPIEFLARIARMAARTAS